MCTQLDVYIFITIFRNLYFNLTFHINTILMQSVLRINTQSLRDEFINDLMLIDH